MDINHTAFIQAQWERYCQMAAAVLIVYEYLIQFSNEVDYFWKRRWSFVKVLFLWSRYYSMAFTIGNVIVFMQNTSESTENLCMKFFHWQNTGATLQYITTQVILQLRLYAMYGRSKKMLAFFVTLTACEITVMGLLFGIPRDGLVGTNNPAPGLFICADADPPHDHWMAYVPTATLITETIFVCLALNKAWEHYKDGSGGQLMPWLTKESVLFFIAIFWVHLANQTIWLVNKITLNELVTGFSFAIPAILANRLLISIRMHNAQPDSASNLLPTQATIKFANHIKHDDSTFINAPPEQSMEMVSVNENSENR